MLLRTALPLLWLATGIFSDGQTTSSTPGPIAAVLQPLVDNGTMAGAVTLVATKDKILDLEAVGYADVAAKKPMTPNTLFWIASMSKTLTATAFMMLVDEGKVSLDDPVAKYIPAFQNQMVITGQDATNHPILKKPDSPLTVRELLSMTSGLGPHTLIESPTLDMLPLEQRVRSYAATPLNFEPGARYSYTNEGINTAGRIIEIISGMPYSKFVDERLLKPLGMNDTTLWPNQEQLSRLAKTYRPNKEKNGLVESPITFLHYPLDDPKRQAIPAGGYFSTASDMAKLCQMILNGGVANGKTYLSPSALKLMLTKQTPPTDKQYYGLGWALGHGVFQHPGNSYGHQGAYKTDMDIDPGLGLITIFMVQERGGWPNKTNPRFAFTAAADKLSPNPGAAPATPPATQSGESPAD